MKLVNIPVEIEKHREAISKSPNCISWRSWVDSVFTARTGLHPPGMSNTARIPKKERGQ